MKKAIIAIVVLIVIVVIIIVITGLNKAKKNGNQPIDPNMTNTETQTPIERSRVILRTNMGAITLELFDDQVPETTKNFIKLANSGFYNGTRFHRVIKDFMIQGGDPLSKDLTKKDYWGTGGPGYEFNDEFVSGLSNVTGTISMANHGPNTNGSQFFINLVDNKNLDFDVPDPNNSAHAVFGHVVEGMDIIEKIGIAPTDQFDRPVQEVIVQEVLVDSTQQ